MDIFQRYQIFTDSKCLQMADLDVIIHVVLFTIFTQRCV